MRFLILSQSVQEPITPGRSDRKKKKKKNHKKSRNRRPQYPRTTLKVNIHIFGLTKHTIHCKNVHVFVPVCFSLCCYYAYFSDYSKPGQAYRQESSNEFIIQKLNPLL